MKPQEIKQHCCDFCTSTDPVTTWSLGKDRVDAYLVNPKTGKGFRAISDADGKWAACQACHDGILKVRSAKLLESAVRRFVGDMAKRANWEKSFPGPGVAKSLRKQQKILYMGLMPLLKDFVPFEGWLKPGETVTLRKSREITMPLQPQQFIPDGQSRGRRL